MKLHVTSPESRSDKRGAALVMVLLFMALITVLVLAFFGSVSTELSSSKSYSDGSSAKALSDSAVSAVIGTIREATSGGTKVAWCSQPGMLRTYDDSGKPLNNYRLYSSDQMIVPGSGSPDVVDTSWKTKPGLYTDLNKPVADTSGVLRYPIIDPAAADPTTGVDGFSVTNAPGYDSSKPEGPTNNKVPMPVKWIYVLRDGSMAVPSSYDPVTSIASFSSAPIPSKTNPIVGRMAFWTDDETAKVNINTASEGTYWDVPVCNTQPMGGGLAGVLGNAGTPYQPDPTKNIYEFDLGEYSVATKEYQRYPGHPATTCLSTIFGKSLVAMDASLGTLPGRGRFVQTFTNMAPRTTTAYDLSNPTLDGTTAGGTRRSGPVGANTTNATATESYYATFRLQPDADRLYASIDELTFSPLTTAPGASTKRPEQLLDKTAADTKKVIDKARFFITAQSRAPELNLFNKPRVAVWPIQVSTAKRTYFDKLIAFCASVGPRTTSSPATPYYFTREDPFSATKDWSARNQAIYKFLQDLTAANVPGFGKNFVSKYTGAERDQILTEIYDYIRCTNLIDYSDPSAPNAAFTPTGYQYATNTTTNSLYLSPINQNIARTSRGQVVPIEPPPGTPGAGTRGIGRIVTISELALVVIRTGPRKDGGLFIPTGNSTAQDPAKTDLQVALIPQMFCPMAGFSALANNFRIRFKNINIKVNGANVFASSPNQSGLYDIGRIPNSKGCDRKFGGYIGYRALLEPDNVEYGPKQSTGAPVDSLPAWANVTITGSSIDPVTGNNLTLGQAVSQGKTMTIGGSVDVDIETPGSSASPTVVQSFKFVFPDATVPIPNRVWVPTTPAQAVAQGVNNAAIVFNNRRGGRFPGELGNGVYTYTNKDIFWSTRNQNSFNFDVVRSVVPVGVSTAGGTPIQGDMRIIAATRNVPATAFDKPLSPAGVPIRPYDDPRCAGVHSMRRGEPSSANGAYYTSGGYGPDAYGTVPAAPNQPSTTTATSNGAAFGSLLAAFPAQYSIAGQPATDYVNYNCRADYNAAPIIPEGVVGVKNSLGEAGDWDNGPAMHPDGAFCNKPDEGADRHRHHGMFGTGAQFLDGFMLTDTPYLSGSNEDYMPQYASFFSPNKMIPSPVMLGSLPTGVKRGFPWQTLLFRPAVDYLPGKAIHPGGSKGGTQLPDHLLLDLFWMPVVDPYAISEPVATAGKINMNYQIIPFSHIKRDTGLRAVLNSVKITALDPNAQVRQAYNGNRVGKLITDYKRGGTVQYGGGGGGQGAKARFNIDASQTLAQFDTMKFNKNEVFVSASEICDVPLVPEGETVASLSTFWQRNVLTGDNSLERPYAHLYSRLTTKSNTYTVHVWVETLNQGVPTGAASTDPRWAQWSEKTGQITAQYRGSTLIERYIDPQDPRLTTYDETYNGANDVDSAGNIKKAGSLDVYYRFRVLNTKRFDR